MKAELLGTNNRFNESVQLDEEPYETLMVMKDCFTVRQYVALLCKYPCYDKQTEQIPINNGKEERTLLSTAG